MKPKLVTLEALPFFVRTNSSGTAIAKKRLWCPLLVWQYVLLLFYIEFFLQTKKQWP